MAIPDEDVARVRAATDIVALIGEHAALKKQGRRWSGLCPFHAEKSPSFSVNAEEGLYYCFGCQASGDAITFVRNTEHLDFAEAVRFLADRAGITIREDEHASGERRQRSELYDAMEAAIAFYHERLLSAPDAGPARDYLRSRGLDGETVRQFRIGWAPDDWDALAQALTISNKVLTDSGLGFVNRRDRRQDAFRARVIFPIFDPSGRPVALGGRILPGSGREGEPKYKNSQETAIYSKRRTLYGLNWAKSDVVAKGEVIVCEGYTDVIGCFRAGIPRAVATCGTSLADEHFKLLRNFARRIVLAYDADNAGQNATSRFYEWEKTHDVDVAVAAIAPGADPGELAHSDPEALRAAIEGARPFLEFRMKRVFEAADLTTAEGRARAADMAIDVIAEHPDALVRDQYAMNVADRCRLDSGLVRERLETARREPKPNPSKARDRGANAVAEDRAPRPRPSGRQPFVPGLAALGLAIHRPDLVADRLEALLFEDPLQRQAFEALANADGLHEAIDRADPEVAELLQQLAVGDLMVDLDAPGNPADGVVAQLLRDATRRQLNELQMEVRTGSAEFKAGNAQIGQVRLWLEGLDEEDTAHEASDRLLAWLLARSGESA